MEIILKKQLAELEKIKKASSLQLVESKVEGKKTDSHLSSLESETKQELSIDQKIVDSLQKIDKTLIKGLLSKDQESLNSNVIKLHDRIKKQTETFEKTLKISPERAKEVTDKSMGLDQFKTIGERVKGFTESFKNFFTLKGFLNKTGLVDPNSDGIIATAVNKRDARLKYVEDRMSMDFEGKKGQGQATRAAMIKANPREEGESDKDYEARLKVKAREAFAKKFDEAQDIKKQQRANEKTIKDLEDRGFTKEQISRRAVDPYAEREKLASKLVEVDKRYKEPKAEVEFNDKKQSSEIIPFPSKEKDAGSFSDEAQLESTRLQERQVGLLEKIEENTRGLSELIRAGGTGGEKASGEEGRGGSLLDMIPGGGFLRGAKRLGGKILRGVKAAGGAIGRAALATARFAGTPMGMKLGGALAVAGGAYTAYRGWTGAEEEKQAELAKIDEAVQSGEITEEEATKQKEAIGEKTVEKKSEAVGEGTGMAAGAIGGAKLGATIGTFIGGPIGTGVGALAGGAIGAFAGSKAGKVVGEYAGKGINLGKKALTSIGDKISGFIGGVKDSYNRGTGGTEAFQNIDQEVNKRALVAGVIDANGNVTDVEKYGAIREQVKNEIMAANPTANRLADQKVSSTSEVVTKETSNGGVTTSTVEQNQGITSKKTLFGSEFLGSLVSKKGLETGSFTGTGSKETTVSSLGAPDKVSTNYQNIIGKRVSGGLFGSDTYKISDDSGEETTVSKSQYNKIQELVEAGKTSEAAKELQGIRDRSKELAGMTPSMSPEETTTPMSAPITPTPRTVPQAQPVIKAAPQKPVDSSSVFSPSRQNASMAAEKKETPVPVIVNAPTTNVSNNKQSVTMPAPIRNDDFSMRDYSRSRLVY